MSVYVPTDWVDGVTPVNAANLDKLEAGVAGAVQKPSGIQDGEVPVWDFASSGWARSGSHFITFGAAIVKGDIQSIRANFSDAAFYTQKVGDNLGMRFRINTDGTLGWADATSWSGLVSLYPTISPLQLTTNAILQGEAGLRGNYVGGTGWIFQAATGAITLNGQVYQYVGGYYLGSGLIRVDRTNSYDIVFASMVLGDPDYRFVLYADGKHVWGAPGTYDTILERLSAAQLKLTGSIDITGNMHATGRVLAYNGSANQIDLLNGQLKFGSAGDAFISRVAAGLLQVNRSLNVQTPIATGQGISVASDSGVAGGVYPTWRVRGDGVHEWGTGDGATFDTNLYRNSANYLRTNDSFVVDGELYVDYGDTGTKIKFGTLGDTTLSRAAAGVLKTDGALAVAGGIGTSFPASPVDGQLFTLVDSLTAPTYVWTFRYVAGISDANKWLFIGGSPIESEVSAFEATSSTTYADLTTLGPDITVPRAGVYICRWGFAANPAANNVAHARPHVGGTAQGNWEAGVGNLAAQYASGSAEARLTGLAASATLRLRYKVNAGSSTFAYRWMELTPIRVA